VCERERQPKKGRKSRKFTRMGQGGLGHQDTSVYLDTRITGHQIPGHQDTWTPGHQDTRTPGWTSIGQDGPGYILLGSECTWLRPENGNQKEPGFINRGTRVRVCLVGTKSGLDSGHEPGIAYSKQAGPGWTKTACKGVLAS